jgi:predicted ester cyclase
MPKSDLHKFFLRYIAALNTHQFRQMAEFMHDDLIVNGQPVTRDQMIAELEAHIAAVPDLVWRVQDLVVEGNRVAAHFLNSGTPIKEWLGSKPTGAMVEYAEHVFHRVRNGRFYEQNFLLDAWSIQKQLG